MPIRLEVARILLARGRAREAAQYLDARPPFPGTATIWDVEWRLERARVARSVGDLPTARLNYVAAVAAWDHADAILQPRVDEARTALRQLGSTP